MLLYKRFRSLLKNIEKFSCDIVTNNIAIFALYGTISKTKSGAIAQEKIMEQMKVVYDKGIRKKAVKKAKPVPKPYQPQYGVIIICNNEKYQEAVYNVMKEKGFKCKIVTT